MANAELRNRLRYALASEAARDQLMSMLGFTTFGTEFFVDADSGNDNNDGLSPDTGLKTVLAAYNKTTSGNHDIIYCSANAAHAIAVEIDVTKGRVHFVGTGGNGRYIGQRTRFELAAGTAGTGIAIIKNTGNGNTFSNIKFRSVDTLSTSIYAFADGGEHTILRNCAFEKATDLGEATAAELLSNGDTCLYDHCTFGNTIYEVSAARQNVMLARQTITGKVNRDCIWEDCLFLVKTTDTDFANVRATGATDIERLQLFKNCTFYNTKLSSATPTDVFDITTDLTQGEILLQDCVMHNITGWADSSRGVFSNAPAGSATGGKGVEVTS